MIKVLLTDPDSDGWPRFVDSYIRMHPFKAKRDGDTIELKPLRLSVMAVDPLGDSNEAQARICPTSMDSTAAAHDFTGIVFRWGNAKWLSMLGFNASSGSVLISCHDPILDRYFWELLNAIASQWPRVKAMIVEGDDHGPALLDERPLAELASAGIGSTPVVEQLPFAGTAEVVSPPTVQPSAPEGPPLHKEESLAPVDSSTQAEPAAKNAPKQPRVPGRLADFNKWRACWLKIKPEWRRGRRYFEIREWLNRHDSELEYSEDVLADIIRAGEAGLLDRDPPDKSR